jgi:hypothetical protein
VDGTHARREPDASSTSVALSVTPTQIEPDKVVGALAIQLTGLSQAGRAKQHETAELMHGRVAREHGPSSLIDGIRVKTVGEVLEQAESAARERSCRGAMVMAGGALETHLKHLRLKYGITWQGHGSIRKYDVRRRNRAGAQWRSRGPAGDRRHPTVHIHRTHAVAFAATRVYS